MDTTTIVAAVGAVVMGILYFIRRRSRLHTTNKLFE